MKKTQSALALILFSMPQKHKWNAKTIGIHLTIIKLGKELPVEAKKPLNFNLLSFLLLEVLYSFEKYGGKCQFDAISSAFVVDLKSIICRIWHFYKQIIKFKVYSVINKLKLLFYHEKL